MNTKNMVNVTQLGAFCIGLYVKEWNRSKNVELKNYIKRLILEENDAFHKNKALSYLEKLVDEQNVYSNFMKYSHSFIYEIQHLLFPHTYYEVPRGDVKIQEAGDLARRDVLLFLDQSFRKGYLEILPCVELEYAALQDPEKDSKLTN
jgi:hypothetical protein